MLWLGFHSQVLSEELREAYRQVQPRIGKTMSHDAQFWQGVKADCPNTKLIGRLFDQWGSHKGDAEEQGKAWANRLYATAAFRDIYDYWESLNEWFGYTSSDPGELAAAWAWADTFQAAFYDRVKEICPRVEPIAGNCGTGNMLGADWLEHFPETLKRYRLYGFHEYDYPTMRQAHEAGLQVGDDGMWQTLRYRRIMPDILTVRPDAKAIVTECGITELVRGKYDIGYTAIMTPEEYWRELRWYNNRLIEDQSYMLGSTIFQASGDHVWETFEILGTSIIDEMGALSPGTPAIEMEEEATMFEFRYGFKDLHDANPDIVGEATSEQFDIPGVMSIQFTSKGILVYRDGAGAKFIAQTLPLA